METGSQHSANSGMQAQFNSPCTNFMSHIAACVMIIIGCVACVVGSAYSAANRGYHFLEADVSLAHPVQHDRVELLVVILICFCGPAFTVLVVQESILRYRKYLLMQFGYVPAHVESVRTPGSIVGSRVRAFYALSQAVFSAWAATAVMQNSIGRPRPNFFALCDYKGFNKGNHSWYGSLDLGSPSNCRDTDSVDMALRSFPSESAAISFAGLGFLAIFCVHLGDVLQNYSWPGPFRSTLICLPLALAAWIATTDMYLNWNHPTDIIAGAIVGFVCAWAAFKGHQGADPDASRRPSFVPGGGYMDATTLEGIGGMNGQLMPEMPRGVM